jgi:aspartate aminotransferase
VREAAARGRRPAAIVLTVPDNPTGTVAPAPLVAEVCSIAAEWGLIVISDEIYAELAHGDRPVSPAELLPDRVVVTTGLSKSLGLGGWRIGFARFPDTPWGRTFRAEVSGLASELWSSPVAPMQEVAAYALSDPEPVRHRIEQSRRLHGRVTGALHAGLVAAGVACRAPSGGFYLYPDLGTHRTHLGRFGITTGAGLATHLLESHGVATLPGVAFGEAASALRLRLATSLAYGADADERRTALSSARPEALPWIEHDLERTLTAITSLMPARVASGVGHGVPVRCGS